MIVLDTDHINAFQYRHSSAARRLSQRISLVEDDAATTIVSFDEHMRGWLAAIHRAVDPVEQIEPYRRLARLLEFYSSWTVLLLDADAAGEFRRLRGAGVRIGSVA